MKVEKDSVFQGSSRHGKVNRKHFMGTLCSDHIQVFQLISGSVGFSYQLTFCRSCCPYRIIRCIISVLPVTQNKRSTVVGPD